MGEVFYADTFRPMAREGRTIQLAWEPHDFSLDANNQPAYRLKNITAGNFDLVKLCRLHGQTAVRELHAQ